MRILGIEFGSWSVKAVEMESRFRRLDILDFHEVRLPLKVLEPTKAYIEATQQILARLPSNPEKIVTSLPTTLTALRFLPIPIKQRKKVERMYRFELEDNIPFKLEESIVEHHVMGTDTGSLVFAAVAPKKHILTHLDWLRSLGVDPDWLTFDGMGACNLFLSLRNSEKKENLPASPTLLIDFGHQKTNLAVFDEDRLEYFRTIAWGGFSVIQSLSLNMDTSLEEAQSYLVNDLKIDANTEKGDNPDSVEAANAARQAFNNFIAEVNHTLLAYRSIYKKQISSSLITGGLSNVWGLDNYIESALDAPTSRFNFLDVFSLKNEANRADTARFGEPLGRALVFTRKTSLSFNFRQQEMGKETSITEISTFLKNPNVLRLGKYIAVLIAILFVHVNVSGFFTDKEAKSAQEDLRKVFQGAFPEVPVKQRLSLTTNPKDLKQFLGKKSNEIDQKLTILKKTRQPVLSMIKLISDSFPQDTKVDVNLLSIDDKQVLVEGVVFQGNLDKATENIRNLKFIKELKVSKDGQRFKMDAQVLGR